MSAEEFDIGYVLWVHDVNNQNWDIDSYVKICDIENAKDFWEIYNYLPNFKHLKSYHMFIMKKGIDPIWEHKDNRNGGFCSFRVPDNEVLDSWEYVGASMVCGQLVDDSYDINGVSMAYKNNFAIIKIWNRDCKNDLTKTLSKNFLKKLPNYTIRYKSNKPEY